MTNWYIGTSGFMISQKLWLQQKQLNCIEINSSFYRNPGERQIRNWLAFPKDIYICLKVNRYLTHIKRLKDIDLIWDDYWNAVKALKPKLKCLLFQMPPSFAFNEVNVQRLKQLHKKAKNNTIVFEFRHISWFNEETYDLFKKFKWTISGVYIKKRNGSWMGTMPNGITLPPKTSNVSYFRVHGSRGYRGALTKSQLKELKSKITKLNCKENFVFFNNVFFNKKDHCNFNKTKIKYAAVCNAIEFKMI